MDPARTVKYLKRICPSYCNASYRGERERSKKALDKIAINTKVCFLIWEEGSWDLNIPSARARPSYQVYKCQHYQFLVFFSIFPLLQIKVSISRSVDSIHSHVHESPFNKFPSRRFLSFHFQIFIFLWWNVLSLKHFKTFFSNKIEIQKEKFWHNSCKLDFN